MYNRQKHHKKIDLGIKWCLHYDVVIIHFVNVILEEHSLIGVLEIVIYKHKVTEYLQLSRRIYNTDTNSTNIY